MPLNSHLNICCAMKRKCSPLGLPPRPRISVSFDRTERPVIFQDKTYWVAFCQHLPYTLTMRPEPFSSHLTLLGNGGAGGREQKQRL